MFLEEGGGLVEGGGVVAEEGEGVGFGVEEGLFAEPGALSFAVLAVASLGCGDGGLAGKGAPEDGDGLGVAEGEEGAGKVLRGAVAAVGLEEAFGFGEEAAVEHLRGAAVDAVVELRAGRLKGEAEDAEAGEGVATALLPLGGEGLLSGEAEGEGAEELGGVVGVDGLGGAGVEAREQAVEVSGAAAGAEGVEALAEGGSDGWRGKETVEQGAEIEAGAADEERQAAAGGDAVDGLAGVAGPVAGGEGLVGIDEIEAVVGDEGAVFEGGFGGADLHAAEDADGVAGEDFGGEALGEAEGEVGLAGGGGAGEDDEGWVGRGGSGRGVVVGWRGLLRGYHRRHQPGVKARAKP